MSDIQKAFLWAFVAILALGGIVIWGADKIDHDMNRPRIAWLMRAVPFVCCMAWVLAANRYAR